MVRGYPVRLVNQIVLSTCQKLYTKRRNTLAQKLTKEEIPGKTNARTYSNAKILRIRDLRKESATHYLRHQHKCGWTWRNRYSRKNPSRISHWIRKYLTLVLSLIIIVQLEPNDFS